MFLTFIEDLIMDPVSQFVLAKGAAACAAKTGAAAKACIAKFGTATKATSTKAAASAKGSATSKAGVTSSRSDCGMGCGKISDVGSP